MNMRERLAVVAASLTANAHYGALVLGAFVVPPTIDEYGPCACSMVPIETFAFAFVEQLWIGGWNIVSTSSDLRQRHRGDEDEAIGQCPAGPSADQVARLLSDVRVNHHAALEMGWPNGIRRLCILVNEAGRVEQAFVIGEEPLDTAAIDLVHRIASDWRFEPPRQGGWPIRTWQRLVLVNSGYGAR